MKKKHYLVFLFIYGIASLAYAINWIVWERTGDGFDFLITINHLLYSFGLAAISWSIIPRLKTKFLKIILSFTILIHLISIIFKILHYTDGIIIWYFLIIAGITSLTIYLYHIIKSRKIYFIDILLLIQILVLFAYLYPFSSSGPLIIINQVGFIPLLALISTFYILKKNKK